MAATARRTSAPGATGGGNLRFMLLSARAGCFFIPVWRSWPRGACCSAHCSVRGPLPLGRVTLDVHTLLFAAAAVLIGFQAVSFAVLGKFFAIRAGLRLPEARFEGRLRRLTLETGLLAGCALLLAGLYLSAGAVWIWGGQGFGPCGPQETLRWVIPRLAQPHARLPADSHQLFPERAAPGYAGGQRMSPRRRQFRPELDLGRRAHDRRQIMADQQPAYSCHRLCRA